MSRPDPKFTAAEKARIAWCVARMAKRGLAGDDVDQSDLVAKLDRVIDGARARAREQRAANNGK